MNQQKARKISDECSWDDSEGAIFGDTLVGGLYIAASSTTPYAFTLRKVTNAQKSNKADYITKFEKFKKMGIQITDYTFEKNHTNTGIHSHGVMQVPKSFSMKRFRTRGWHIHLDEIKDHAGWLAYITKENVLESQLLLPESPKDPDFKMPTQRLFD